MKLIWRGVDGPRHIAEVVEYTTSIFSGRRAAVIHLVNDDWEYEIPLEYLEVIPA